MRAPPSAAKSPSITHLSALPIYDVITVIVLIVATVTGAVRGFAWQVASIAAIVGSYVVAMKYREPFSQHIQWEQPWNTFAAMLILYLGTSLVVWMSLRVVAGIIDRMKLREFDRQIGALFGLAKGLLLCCVMTLFGVTLLGDSVRRQILASLSGNLMTRLLDESHAVMPPELHQLVGPWLDELDAKLNRSPAAADFDAPSSSWHSALRSTKPRQSLFGASSPQSGPERTMRWRSPSR